MTILCFQIQMKIPRPDLLKNLDLKKKNMEYFYRIFTAIKFNLFNEYESPWEGTRVCKNEGSKIN